MRFIWTTLLLTCAALAQASPRVSLQALENELDAAPEVLIAVAQMQESIYMLERQRATRGLKLFGSVGYADVSEAVTDSLQRSYRRASVLVGLSYPLLGSRRAEELAVLEAQKTVEQRALDEKLARARSMASLRKQYIDYWAAQQRLTISGAFLGDEADARSWLLERTRAGYLLEADRLEFLSAFDLVRRNVATDHLILDRSRDTLGMLTRNNLTQFEAVPPSLPEVCLDRDQLQADVLDRHPEIDALRRELVLQERYAQLRSPVQANLRLSASRSDDFPRGIPGDSLALSFNVNMPLNWRASTRAIASADAAAHRSTQYRLDLRTRELMREVDDALGRYGIAIEQLTFSEQRTAAALESVRERQLRAETLAGDVQEQLQQGRFAYYASAIDLTNAESQLLKAKADVLALSDIRCGDDSVVPESGYDWNVLRGARSTQTGLLEVASAHPQLPLSAATRGVYVWDSEPVIASPQSTQHFVDRGFDRVLLSLNGRQIKRLKSRFVRHELETWLAEARDAGLRVDLLLGEPTWMLPAHRQELFSVISELRHLPFNGLHLDLEPGMIDESVADQDEARRELFHTLQASIQASPWPVSLSLHFRDLTESDRYCLGCSLENLQVEDVSLMVYVRNPRRVAEIVEPIRRRFPQLPLSIAQSVERELSSEESHASGDLDQMETRLQDLQAFTESEDMNGLLIQSWAELQELRQ